MSASTVSPTLILIARKPAADCVAASLRHRVRRHDADHRTDHRNALQQLAAQQIGDRNADRLGVQIVERIGDGGLGPDASLQRHRDGLHRASALAHGHADERRRDITLDRADDLFQELLGLARWRRNDLGVALQAVDVGEQAQHHRNVDARGALGNAELARPFDPHRHCLDGADRRRSHQRQITPRRLSMSLYSASCVSRNLV